MPELVSVCICTFRRASLFATLDSIALAVLPEGVSLTVIVVDNDDTAQLETRVREYAGSFLIPIRYVHAPGRNISIARNAALDAVETSWAAFIDDDEVADRAWLSALWAHHNGTHAVLGQSSAVYSTDMPAWLHKCDFHSNRVERNPINGYTSNVLIDVDFIRKNRINFRNELGRSGGEDTIFFREIDRAGGVIIYCEDSVVFERVVPARANMRWVCRRNFRAGQTHGLMCSEFERAAYARLSWTAAAKAIFSLIAALLSIPGTVNSRRWIARACLHVGAISYRFKPTIIEEYGS